MIVPRPLQCEAAMFLAGRAKALLASEPRTGKTGSAIMAAEMARHKRVLVITTASGRAVWAQAFRDWAPHRPPADVVLTTREIPTGSTVIVGWPGIIAPVVRHALLAREWDVIIADESHVAARPDSQRTQALYGRPDAELPGLVARAGAVWCLTGTPMPNTPDELWPMLRALAPERLAADEARGWPDVTEYEAFFQRFVRWKPRQISRWKTVRVAIEGQRIDELRARLDGFWLRHTQRQVGIQPPAYELLPLTISAAQRRAIEAAATPQLRDILVAAEAGSTKDLEMHMGPLRRLTGEMKAIAVAELVRDELESGTRKVVIFAWHTDVINQLVTDSLACYHPVALHGGTSTSARAENVKRFQTDPACRVFVGQIRAAGEAIDLSAADELIFVESSFTPKDMQQAASRITNMGKAGATRVRVAALAGSVDEAIQRVITRKLIGIRALLSA